MQKHFQLLIVILTALLPSAIPSSCWAQQQDRPNVVMIMCDDLGWGDVGFNGNQVIQTPHLDKMAKNSLRFTRFYAGSSVCSPTRGSVITGRHPFRYGIPGANKGHMKPNELTVAELLKELNYTTGHFGKWHLGTLTKTLKEANRGGPRGVAHFSPPQQNGFDVCFSTESKVPTFDPMIKPAENAKQTGWNFIQDKSSAKPYKTHYWDEQGEMVTANLDGDDSRIIMDRAIPFIEQAIENDQPFMAVIWFHTPHLPVVAGPEHAALYKNHETYSKNYFGCITAMDEQVGRLRAALQAGNVSDNTMVMFCSDNGPEGNETAPGSAGPFRGRKRSLYEGGIRVPGLIEWPARIEPGSVTDFPAVTSDYLPTILDAVQVEMPDARPLDGLSLIPVFEDNSYQRTAPIGFAYGKSVALSDNRYKLIKRPRGTTYELFDLIDDPQEKNDIATQHPAIVTRMTTALDAWRKSCQESEDRANH